MFLDVRGTHIGYDCYGDGETHLLLLHAFPLNRKQWEQQGQGWATTFGGSVVALDLLGFGESGIETGPTTMDLMAEYVFGAMDALHVERCAVCGLSLGGYVAFAMLRQHPERISGLVLADTRATADTPQQRQGREESAQSITADGVVAFFDRDVPRLFGQTARNLHPQIVDRAREIARLNNDIGAAAAARGMGLRPDSTALLPNINVPTLVLVGGEDAIIPHDQAHSMAQAIPNAEFAVIQSAGHLSNMEQASRFGDAVARFMQGRVLGLGTPSASPSRGT
ncbi:MAG TPA: alpha/beta fold hydrolase [Ktedonobacterales bacterium]|nr:alpha/beta fold hydrolase [Ktedonobacterales bacterium]